MCDLRALVPHPGADRDADAPGQLLIAALRCHAAGTGCDLLGFLELALGRAEAPAAARALAGFARALLAGARRPVRLGEAGEPPTADELAAARLVGALADGDVAVAGRLLAWLAPPPARARLLAAAATLATRLAQHALPAAAE
jgi:hypothetical protein